MAKPDPQLVDSILEEFVRTKRSRGAYRQSAFDRFAPERPVETSSQTVDTPVEQPVVVNGQLSSVPTGALKPDVDFERIAKPVLTSWLKGKGGLQRVATQNLWDTDKVGGVTANEYFRRAMQFDDPSLPTTERLTQMIYGAETSGNPNAWRTINSAGYMGRAQIGNDFMKDYGIDKRRYLSDPTYQHQATMDAVGRRVNELSGRWFADGGRSIAPVGTEAVQYPEGDTQTEDLLIFTPKGELYGAMRYDELVFSQRDSKRIDQLVRSGKTDQLGKFVARARKKHDDFTTTFAGGGKTEDPELKALRKNRLDSLRELKGKMPDDLYNRYEQMIHFSTDPVEIRDAYNNALRDWSGSDNGGSPQSPDARSVNGLKRNYIRDLRSLGMPPALVRRYEREINNSLTAEGIRTAYERANSEWTVANESAVTATPVAAPTTAPVSNFDINSLVGGISAQQIKDDIAKIKLKKRELTALPSTPERRRAISLLDEMVAGLDNVSTALTPNFERAIQQGRITPQRPANAEQELSVRQRLNQLADEATRGMGALADLPARARRYLNDQAADLTQTMGDMADFSPFDAVREGFEAVRNKVTNNVKGAGSDALNDVTRVFRGLGNVGRLWNELGSLGDRAGESVRGLLPDLSLNNLVGKLGLGVNAAGPSTTALTSGPGAANEPTGTGAASASARVGGPSPALAAGIAGSTGRIGETSDRVRRVQEYLNGFLSAKTLEQQGYSRGTDGELYDADGKRVPLDKIAKGSQNEQITVDGQFGPETEQAIRLYNAENPTQQINYRDTGDGLFLDEAWFAPESQTPAFMRQYIETGSVPRYDRSKVPANRLSPNLTPTKGVKSYREMGIREALPVIPKGQKSGQVSGGTTAARSGIRQLFIPQNLERIGGNVTNLLQAGVAYNQANAPLPIYEQSADWVDYTNQVRDRANAGLNSAVQAEFQRNLDRNARLGFSQVVSAAGGGGTQGAVLGALGQVNQAGVNAMGQYALMDQAQRDQNFARFGTLAMQNEAANLNAFQNRFNQRLQANQQAGMMIPGLLQQIEDRNNYYNAYQDPSGAYQRMIQSQIQRQTTENELLQRLATNPDALRSGLGFGTTGGSSALSPNDQALLKRNGG